MHKFRASFMNSWKEVTIENDTVLLLQRNKIVSELPISEITEIHMSSETRDVYTSKIVTPNKTIRFNTNYPESAVTVIQQCKTFTQFQEALRVHPNNSALYILGSKGHLVYGIVMLISAITFISLALFITHTERAGAIGFLVPGLISLLGGLLWTFSSLPKKIAKPDELPYRLSFWL